MMDKHPELLLNVAYDIGGAESFCGDGILQKGPIRYLRVRKTVNLIAVSLEFIKTLCQLQRGLDIFSTDSNYFRLL